MLNNLRFYLESKFYLNHLVYLDLLDIKIHLFIIFIKK
jgi:hypothetical protein